MRLIPLILVLVMFTYAGANEKVGNWDGEIHAPVTVRVVDDKDGKPVVSARVWLLTSGAYYAYKAAARDAAGFTKANGPIERFGSRVFSDGEGSTTIWTPFEAGGDILADGTRTTYRFVHGILIVEDWKHERYESELEALLPKEAKDSAPISITVKLKEKANQSSTARRP
jgi:hypothetical protein